LSIDSNGVVTLAGNTKRSIVLPMNCVKLIHQQDCCNKPL
jgi:hypothetical protein